MAQRVATKKQTERLADHAEQLLLSVMATVKRLGTGRTGRASQTRKESEGKVRRRFEFKVL